CISFIGCASFFLFFFFQAEDGIRDFHVTGVQTCALPISWSSSASTNRYFTRRFVAGAFRQSGTLVCLRAAITVCADTCHASSGPHRPLLRYDCSTASSTSRAFTPSLTRWWGVTPMTASARYAYCLPARWRKYVRS